MMLIPIENAWSIPTNVLRLGDWLHYLALMSQSPAANSPQAARPAAPAAAPSSMARPAPTDEDFMKVRMMRIFKFFISNDFCLRLHRIWQWSS